MRLSAHLRLRLGLGLGLGLITLTRLVVLTGTLGGMEVCGLKVLEVQYLRLVLIERSCYHTAALAVLGVECHHTCYCLIKKFAVLFLKCFEQRIQSFLIEFVLICRRSLIDRIAILKRTRRKYSESNAENLSE